MIVIQDQEDERHIMLRPIETVSFTKFVEPLERYVDPNTELWELTVGNRCATRIPEEN